MKTSRISCLVMATLLAGGSFARGQSLAHVDDLAVTAERQARQVFFQTHRLRASGLASEGLRRNALRMMQLASHIHELAHVDRHIAPHRHGFRADRQSHINRDVAELDRLVHETQDLSARLRSRVCVERPAYHGSGGGRVALSISPYFSLNIRPRGCDVDPHSRYYAPHVPSTAGLDLIDASLARLVDTVHHLLEDTNVRCCRR